MHVDKLPPGTPIVAYGSRDARYQSVARLPDGAVGMIALGPRGHVGLHESPLAQSVVVVAGSGFVHGATGEAERVVVGIGDVVRFERGEAHAVVAGSDGLTLLVVEGVREGPGA